MTTLLKVEGVHTFINQYHILQGITFEAKEGEVSVLLGRNGAGKTTTLKTILGLTPASKGSVLFKGEDITKKPTYGIANKGIGYVPEDQGIFASLTVEENMKVAMRKDDKETLAKQDYVLNLFPDLKKFWKKDGGHLSGGQKQMPGPACVGGVWSVFLFPGPGHHKKGCQYRSLVARSRSFVHDLIRAQGVLDVSIRAVAPPTRSPYP
mgnify:CR=1 FL=1